jgi:transcriptional regulator with XRE-family HTH domain
VAILRLLVNDLVLARYFRQVLWNFGTFVSPRTWITEMDESPDPRSSMCDFIAYYLRFLRRQHGWSGGALAELLNCARSSISRLESGQAKLALDQAEKLDAARNPGGLFGIMIQWRKSSRSQGPSDCVEVANLSGNNGLRDSENPGIGRLSTSVESLASPGG